ncbi:MAG TPA: hypothetical protein VGE00_08800 [Gammaproteobacteria bacterium]
MSYTALSLSQTPPLTVPLRYLLTAPLFAAAAGVVLAVAPEALVNRWTPATLAITHLLTLGFLAMTMFGALQQLLPVLAGSLIPRAPLFSVMVHLGLASGVAALAAGMGTGHVWLLQLGTLLLLVTVALFAAVMGGAMLLARSAHATVWAMGGALVALLVTVLLGSGLLHHYGWQVPLAHPLTELHLMWGLAGWVGALLIGVAWQVVPMFQLTPDYPPRLRRYLVPLLLSGLALWSVARFAGVAADVPFALVLLALLVFALATLWVQQHRRRRLPDVTLAFWRLAMVMLLGALLAMALPGDHALLSGVLFIIGFAMSAVNGMLYKIVPFLIWLHLNNQLQQRGQWQGRVPNMKQIIAEVALRRHFRLHLLALGLLLLAVIWPMTLARAAGTALAISSLMLWWNLAQGWRVYRAVLRGAAG